MKKLKNIIHISFRLLILFCFFFNPVIAQEKKINKQLEEAKTTLKKQKNKETKLSSEVKKIHSDLYKFQKKLVKDAKEIRNLEHSSHHLKDKIKKLNHEYILRKKELAIQNKNLSDAISISQRLSLTPQIAGLLLSQTENDFVQKNIALRSIVKNLRSSTNKLQNELRKIIELRNFITIEQENLSLTLNKLKTQKEKTNAIILQKKELQLTNEAEIKKIKKRISDVSKKVNNFEDLIKKIKKNEKNKKQLTSFHNPAYKKYKDKSISSKKGTLFFPVQGKIQEFFKDQNGKGIISKGITVKTIKNGQVISPFNGKIVYAGHFRSYGNILIIDHGEDYHTLLAGVDKIFTEIGSYVLSGEPIGEMGQNSSNKLYIEFRKKGIPTNPLNWLTYKKDNKDQKQG